MVRDKAQVGRVGRDEVRVAAQAALAVWEAPVVREVRDRVAQASDLLAGRIGNCQAAFRSGLRLLGWAAARL